MDAEKNHADETILGVRLSELGWYERVIFRRMLAVPVSAWTEVLGMRRPRWWEYWKRESWAKQVSKLRGEMERMLQEGG